jgi:hypothetical protein
LAVTFADTITIADTHLCANTQSNFCTNSITNSITYILADTLSNFRADTITISASNA